MDIEKNPYAVLLAQLCGIPPAPIRARQGWQQLMKERYPDVIAPAVSSAWAERIKDGIKPGDKNDAVFRADVARMAFAKLSPGEQKQLIANAKRDKDAAVATYKLALEESRNGSVNPERRQA